MKKPRRPSLLTTLGNVEFRALWIAETQSFIGDQLTTVALSIVVYQRTDSALWAAIVYSLTFLPALAGGLGLSHLADKYPRRLVLSVSSLTQATLIGIMAIPGMPLPLLCVVLVFVRLASAPANAAQNALTRDIFTDDDLYLRSQDIRGITTNIAMLVGLAGGGIMVSFLGISWALAIDAFTFLVSAFVVHRWVAPRPATAEPGNRWFTGIQHVFSRSDLRILVWFSWLVGLAVIPEGLAAPLAAEIGAPPEAIGWLLAADPCGFVLGTYLLSRFVAPEQRQRILGLLAALPLAVLIGFAFQPNLVSALLLLGLSGAAGAYIITVTATFVTWTPNEIRGSATGVYRTGLRVAQGVGVALGGIIAELTHSAMNTIAIAGVIGVFIAIPIAIRWKKICAGHASGDNPEKNNN